MTNDAQRAAIQQMIQRHTQIVTSDKKTARDSLIREGVYTTTGQLSANFGGKKTATK